MMIILPGLFTISYTQEQMEKLDDADIDFLIAKLDI